MPGYVPPPAGAHGSCTATDVTTFTTNCITDGNCANTGLSSAACYSCLYSESTSASWGAIIDYGNSTYAFNVGGCYLAMGASVACAAAAEEQGECEVAACDAACVATNTDATTCITSADSGECASYVSSVNTACGTTYTSAAACGANATTSETLFEAMAATFCE